MREPNKQPYSLIFALDQFKFLFQEQSCLGDKIDREILVASGHAIVFTNALNHAGGTNIRTVAKGEDPYVYRLFAYVVSNPVDYQQGDGGTIKPIFETGNADTLNEEACVGSPSRSIRGRVRKTTDKFNPCPDSSNNVAKTNKSVKSDIKQSVAKSTKISSTTANWETS